MDTFWHKYGWIPATVAGSLVFAVGFAFFLQPNDMSPGGISGLALVAVQLLAGALGEIFPYRYVALAFSVVALAAVFLVIVRNKEDVRKIYEYEKEAE